MNLPRVGDELERGGGVRAHYRDPNDAGVSELFHRDPRFAVAVGQRVVSSGGFN
jgi:hypothetical protein